MRILQIHNYYATRGGECQVVDDEKRLLESRGHIVDQFARSSAKLAACSFVGKVHDFIGIPYNSKVGRNLEEYLAQGRPDVVHAHNVFPLLSPSVYSILRRCGVPVVQTVHNYRFLCPAGTFFTRGQICERCQNKGWEQAIYHRCVRNSAVTSIQYARAIQGMWRRGLLQCGIHRYIALNQFSLEKLAAAGVPRQRIEVCGNFASVIGAPGMSKGDYVLFMGRLSPEKGVRTLLNAAARVSCARIVFAGTGQLQAEVQSAASELKNVDYIGYVTGKEKQRLIARAKAMVVPSEWYENFPISVVESLAMGTPVIASDIGGLPEMVEHGRTGYLCESGSVEEFAEAIERIASDAELSMEMGASALKHAQEKFSAEGHVIRLEEIYAAAMSAAVANSGIWQQANPG